MKQPEIVRTALDQMLKVQVQQNSQAKLDNSLSPDAFDDFNAKTKIRDLVVNVPDFTQQHVDCLKNCPTLIRLTVNPTSLPLESLQWAGGQSSLDELNCTVTNDVDFRQIIVAFADWEKCYLDRDREIPNRTFLKARRGLSGSTNSRHDSVNYQGSKLDTLFVPSSTSDPADVCLPPPTGSFAISQGAVIFGSDFHPNDLRFAGFGAAIDELQFGTRLHRLQFSRNAQASTRSDSMAREMEKLGNIRAVAFHTLDTETNKVIPALSRLENLSTIRIEEANPEYLVALNELAHLQSLELESLGIKKLARRDCLTNLKIPELSFSRRVDEDDLRTLLENEKVTRLELVGLKTEVIIASVKPEHLQRLSVRHTSQSTKFLDIPALKAIWPSYEFRQIDDDTVVHVFSRSGIENRDSSDNSK